MSIHAQMTEAEIAFRASLRSKSLETAADSLYLAAILATRPENPP